MIRMNDTFDVSEFTARPADFIDRLKRTGEPEYLTVDGEEALVLQDAKTYRRMWEELERLLAIEGIRRGLADAEAGRMMPADEFLDEMKRKFNIPDEA